MNHLQEALSGAGDAWSGDSVHLYYIGSSICFLRYDDSVRPSIICINSSHGLLWSSVAMDPRNPWFVTGTFCLDT